MANNIARYNDDRVDGIYSLQDWINNRIDSDMEISTENDPGLWQAMFARDCLHPLLQEHYDKREDEPMQVVSVHNSKSQLLPVMKFVDMDRGIRVWMRNNFYNWKFSVRSRRPIPDVFHRLFDRDDPVRIDSVYCEGFHSSWVFGPYAQNQCEFTVEVPGSLFTRYFGLGTGFTFCFLLGEVTHG